MSQLPELILNSEGKPHAVVLPYADYLALRDSVKLTLGSLAESGSAIERAAPTAVKPVTPEHTLYFYRSGDYFGQGHLVNHPGEAGARFMLHAGAELCLEPAPSAQSRILPTLQALQDKGLLEQIDAHKARLCQDTELASATLAASMISGCSRSGPRSFRDEHGRLMADCLKAK